MIFIKPSFSLKFVIQSQIRNKETHKIGFILNFMHFSFFFNVEELFNNYVKGLNEPIFYVNQYFCKWSTWTIYDSI